MLTIFKLPYSALFLILVNFETLELWAYLKQEVIRDTITLLDTIKKRVKGVPLKLNTSLTNIGKPQGTQKV